MGKINAYHRKDGRWEARVLQGIGSGSKRIYRYFYGTSKEEAESKAAFACKMTFEPVLTEMTVKELCSEWLSVMANRVKLSTLANYRMKIEKHILPAFGGKMCCEISSKTAYAFIEKKLSAGLSARYVSDIMVLLKSIFKHAKREYGMANPFEDIVMPKCIKHEVRLLTVAEQKTLRTYIKNEPAPINLGVMLALSMGLRVGEVCGLMWQDIDMEKRILSVRRTVQRIPVPSDSKKTRVIVSPPKSVSSAREIPIPDDVFVMLKKVESALDCYILSGNDQPVEPRKMQYDLARILKNAKLPSVRFLSLRHAFASKAIEVGFDVKTLSEILGHSKIELTMNLYVHSNIDRKRSCMKLMKWSA
ncbi:MAG: site-specific integrase [Ruminococcus sp.]|nr:site-specific integrase [Ruminococcus sp.]